MKKLTTRMIAMLIVVVMVCAMLPTFASAAPACDHNMIKIKVNLAEKKDNATSTLLTTIETPCLLEPGHTGSHKVALKDFHPSNFDIDEIYDDFWIGYAWMQGSFTNYSTVTKTLFEEDTDATITATASGVDGVTAINTFNLVYQISNFKFDLNYDTNGGTVVDKNGETQTSWTDTSWKEEITYKSLIRQTPEVVPTREGYNFLGWATTPNATEPEYLLGDYVTITRAQSGKITLYAVWESLAPPAEMIKVNVYFATKPSSGTPVTELIDTIEVPCQKPLGHAQSHTLELKNFHPDYFDIDERYAQYYAGYYFGNLSGYGKYTTPTAAFEKDTTKTIGTQATNGVATFSFLLVYKVPNTKFTLNYDANGGTGAPEPWAKWLENVEASFPIREVDCPTRDGYEFLGWATTADAVEPEYVVGDEITITAETTIYAVWNQLPVVEKTSAPAMDKTVDVTTVTPGQTVTYTLTSNVPDYLGDYLNAKVDAPTLARALVAERGSYVVVLKDSMDAALSYNGDIAVTVNGKALAADLYTVNTNAADATFEVTMDLVAIYDAGEYFTFEEIEACPEIVATYTATLSADATAGTYTNTAWVAYEDAESEKSSVSVNVYGISIFKFDQATGEGLAGAQFVLTDAERNEIVTLTSGEDGYVSAILAAGTYYLEETVAPEGYVKSDEAIEIVLPTDAGADNIAKVLFANAQAPHTGGNGTTIFTILGIVFIAAAGVFFVISRKKNTQAN